MLRRVGLTHISSTPQEILESSRRDGYWVQRGLDLNRDEFYDFCSSITKPWSVETHKIHRETVDENEIVNWSSNTRFGKMSIPWHADNPWHEKYKFPLRAFYAVKIPDPEDGSLAMLNITDWFEDLSEKEKEYFRSLKVLTQCYKGGCQPFWSSFVKIHPITKKESFYWGAMPVPGDTYGLQQDEGVPAPRFSFTMAIQKPNRDLVLPEEINEWFSDMLKDKYLYVHKWQVGDLLILDNWINVHYRGTITTEEERLLWRKTLYQPWQMI